MAITTAQYFHILTKHFKQERDFETACANTYPDALRLGCQENEIFDHLDTILNNEQYLEVLYQINRMERGTE